MTPPSLPISESAATQCLVADFYIGSGIAFGADIRIGSDIVFIANFRNNNDTYFHCRFLNGWVR
jgi:hypothetical protein